MAEVVHKRKRDKLAIVGFASSTRAEAPLQDDSFELWGCNELGMVIDGKWDAWFNIHKFNEIAAENAQWLAQQKVPVYLVDQHPDIPNSVRYPLEAMCEKFPRRYFCSGIGYMLALAIDSGYEFIGLYGVDMALESEYQYQRPNCEYFIGLAEGRGIEVYVPKASQLMKGPWLYGFEDPPVSAYSDILHRFAKQREQTQKDLKKYSSLSKFAEGLEHGLAWAYAQIQCAQREVGGCAVTGPEDQPVTMAMRGEK